MDQLSHICELVNRDIFFGILKFLRIKDKLRFLLSCSNFYCYVTSNSIKFLACLAADSDHDLEAFSSTHRLSLVNKTLSEDGGELLKSIRISTPNDFDFHQHFFVRAMLIQGTQKAHLIERSGRIIESSAVARVCDFSKMVLQCFGAFQANLTFISLRHICVDNELMKSLIQCPSLRYLSIKACVIHEMVLEEHFQNLGNLCEANLFLTISLTNLTLPHNLRKFKLRLEPFSNSERSSRVAIDASSCLHLQDL